MSNKIEPAFVLGEGDRFHSISVSEPVHYEGDADVETVLAFYIIRRRAGTFDIVFILRTFKGKTCISRNVQKKTGIAENKIGQEIRAIKGVFSAGIEKGSGHKMIWNELELDDVNELRQQVGKIRQWGRLNVFGDDGGLN